MFKSPTAKRFRAIALALGITLLTNYAISFAAKSSTPNQQASGVLQINSACQSANGLGQPVPPRP
jgi:hypothetical protein